MSTRQSTYHQHRSTASSSTAQLNSNSTTSSTSSSTNTSSSFLNKNRQYAHLHAQLAQLNAHLADTENLMRMTAGQAQDMRFLGGYVGALFMGSARILGEDSVKGRATGAGRETVSEDTKD